MSDQHFETIAAAHVWQCLEQPQPISVPIYSSSTFKFGTVERGANLIEGKVICSTSQHEPPTHPLSGNPEEFDFLPCPGSGDFDI